MTGVMLSYDADRPSAMLAEVAKALVDHGVAYSVAFVDSFAEPRLSVEGVDLVGREILDRFDEILHLVRAGVPDEYPIRTDNPD